MKVLIVLALAAVVAAEPPRYRNARFQFQRQELAPEGNREATTPRQAPYPASGWKPAKEFNLPRQQQAIPPATSYGTPDVSYGTPSTSYSAPQNEYGAPEPTTELPDTENLQVRGLEKSAKQIASDVLSKQGAYYVLLPDSKLQRVEFRTENDLRNMAYTARIQYRDEDRAPIYVYTGQPEPAGLVRAAYIQYL